jgi:hypothetical protein
MPIRRPRRGLGGIASRPGQHCEGRGVQPAHALHVELEEALAGGDHPVVDVARPADHPVVRVGDLPEELRVLVVEPRPPGRHPAFGDEGTEQQGGRLLVLVEHLVRRGLPAVDHDAIPLRHLGQELPEQRGDTRDRDQA